MTLATERDVVLRIDAEPGRFVRHGTVLVRVWPSATVDDALCDSVRAAFIIGSARTPTQDVQFFVEQLVELAVRALSPGINDPGTARMCLDRLGQTLCQMATREMPASCRYDDNGRLRVMARPVSFESMAATAFDEIRRYGRSSVSVTVHLLDVIRDVAGCVMREPDRLALVKHAAADHRTTAAKRHSATPIERWWSNATAPPSRPCSVCRHEHAARRIRAHRRLRDGGPGGAPSQLQIMCGLAGERRLTESEVPGLPGYEGSRPVRIGNGAHGQLQLDVFGEVMDALHQARRGGLDSRDEDWAFQRALLEHLAAIWRQPDAGLWEVRGGVRPFTYSKVMAWVAFDRGIRAVETLRR